MASKHCQGQLMVTWKAPGAPKTPNYQVGGTKLSRCHALLRRFKSDECLWDGGSEPSRTQSLEGSWPPNTDRADGW